MTPAALVQAFGRLLPPRGQVLGSLRLPGCPADLPVGTCCSCGAACPGQWRKGGR